MENLMTLATPQDMVWITPLTCMLTQWTKNSKVAAKIPTQLWAVIIAVVAFAVKTIIAQPDLTSNPKNALLAAASAVVKGVIAASMSSNTVAFVNRVKEQGFASASVLADTVEDFAPCAQDIVEHLTTVTEDTAAGLCQAIQNLAPGATVTITVKAEGGA